MPISQAISAHIPYLRRFSRALTGTQAGGDAYVLATLEAIVADPAEFSKCGRSKDGALPPVPQGLGDVTVNDHVDTAAFTGDEDGAHRHLEAITLRPRIAFLLSSLEGFDTERSRGRARLLGRRGGTSHRRRRQGDCQPNSDRCLDHRGRAFHRARSSEPRRGARAPCAPMSRGPIARRSRPSNANGQASSLQTFSSPTEARGSKRSIRILESFSVPVIFITAYPERLLDRNPARTRLSDHQALQNRKPEGRYQSGPFLRSQIASQGRARKKQKPRLILPGAPALRWSASMTARAAGAVWERRKPETEALRFAASSRRVCTMASLR